MLGSYALGALPLAFVLYSAPLYLARPLGCSQAFIGKVLWLPPLGWEAGYFFWGWLSDRGRVSMRMLILLAGALGLPFAAIPFAGGVPWVLALLCLASFAASGFIVLPVTHANRVYGPGHAGLIAGAGAGAWSAAVAVVMPLFGRLFDQQNYGLAFWIAASFPVLGTAAWVLLSPAPARAEATSG